LDPATAVAAAAQGATATQGGKLVAPPSDAELELAAAYLIKEVLVDDCYLKHDDCYLKHGLQIKPGTCICQLCFTCVSSGSWQQQEP
jgi:hypothetical protein